MDRSWMYYAPKYSVPFTNGVETFLDFAFEKSSVNGKILCPCTHCVNALYFGRQDVSDHLITLGFHPEYLKWVYHGEDSTTTSSGTSTMHNVDHDMYGMLNDVFQTNIGGSGVETHETTEEKFYPGCKYNKLSAVVHLYHIKCLNGCSNKSLDMMLEFLNDLLPEGNLLPKTTQQVKKIMSNLGLGYEKIHACPKGCVLFWEEKEKDESCSECGSSRWKESRDNLEIGNSPPKKKAAKILRWFPLKPRLQRLFMCSKTASLMTWHHEGRVNDGKIRHPADAQAWKDFDIKFPEFASEPRNVRLTLASDGFNPFRTMNVSNSIWLVVIIPYNLPPWLVMKQPNLILSLIIPGPSSPGNKINVYMQPLIKELKELWDVGVETYDASNKQNFQLKAALMSTISDFPGYASLSGWSTKGALACLVCGFDTDSTWLPNGKKHCYMCHRRWLPSDHRCRKDTRSFDGKEELRAAPKPSSGEEVLQELDDTEFLQELDGPWKKKSIFFMLPYWEHLLLRHNLDVMHIEKNVCDNIVKTLLGQGKKNKDTTFMPRASYQMTGDEKGVFLRNLKLIRRRKRICIITTDIPTEGGQSNEDQSTENEINGETSEHSATDIPSKGAQKKRVRGYTRKTETWNMNNSHKILVTFNEFDKPIGDEGNELTQYLGTLAKFVIHPEETPEIKSWIFYSMGKKWRTWKASLKVRFYDESLSVDEMMALQASMDNRVNPVQFEKLVTQWCNPEYKSMCKVRIESRKKMEEPHVSGTKSFARLAHEVELETGVYPTRGQVYVKWHTRKYGKSVNGKVSEVVSSSSTQGSVSNFSNDDYSQVKGPEKRGYIRCIGRMPAIKKVASSTRNPDPAVEELKAVVGVMAKIIQENIPNSNLSAVLSKLNIKGVARYVFE
ncbi:hypothetical protein LXL04_032279 [Taraxacum kok-saghyz]